MCVLYVLYSVRINTLLYYVDEAYWMSVGKNELDEALNMAANNKVAKNVILFIGDGMGPNTVTATRIYKHGESGRLTFEKFPHVGLLKVSTYTIAAHWLSYTLTHCADIILIIHFPGILYKASILRVDNKRITVNKKCVHDLKSSNTHQNNVF